MPVAVALAALIYVPMLVEARRAAANEAAQLRRGGSEPAGDAAIYRLMQVVYPGAFAVMLGEHFWRGGAARDWLSAGLACFAVAKALKWWAIVSLGQFWTFRVIVLPGAVLVRRGPYRWLRHPNYVGVVGEFLGAAMMTAASVSGPLVIVLFGILLKRRIALEERALDSSARHPPCSL